MKAFVASALVVVLCGASGAQDGTANPVGTWKCEYEIGGQKRTSVLTVTKAGDKLAATMTWPDQKDAPLKDVKQAGAALTFSGVREFMGNKIPIDYTLTITGDTFKGKGTSDRDGTKQSFDITGTREKAAK